MKLRVEIAGLVAMIGIAVAGLAVRARALNYPLSTEAIREAYFIGSRRDKSTADFLDKYTRHFPVPRTGPEIEMIQLETPFARIVERSEQAVNYYAPDAVQDFSQHPPEFRLRVQIYFTPSYGAVVSSANGKFILRADDFWRDFKIDLIQGTGRIHPSRVTAHRLLGPAGDVNQPARWIGAEVELYYPPTEVGGESAEVEVLAPDGNTTRASFNLAELR